MTFTSAFAWAGGALFVGALAFCGYSYGVTWSRAAPLTLPAAGVDALLFSVFALHHSLFARESARRWLSAAVPEPMLRSVYVWLASLLLIGVCLMWQTVGGAVYSHRGLLALAHGALQIAGLVIIAMAVRTIDPLELAGIRRHPAAPSLQIAGPYRWVRHPLYSGWLLVTFGAAHMTGDRLIFAGISVLYLLIAMPFEERSLGTSFGEAYVEYQRQVRYRLVPYVY
jgi:protein-S-isoprenylcysteine O-methyltransferase Ste14